MKKILIVLLISASLSYCLTMEDDIASMKKQTNEQILNEFNELISFLIKQNDGYVKTAEYEGMTGIITTKIPPIIQWNLVIKYDLYKASMLEYLKRDFKDTNPQKYKIAIQRMNNGEFETMVKKESSNRLKQYTCSRKDYLYILNRGISMIFYYTKASGAFFNRVEINKNICKQLGY